jgi:excinuclease ABC subunit C
MRGHNRRVTLASVDREAPRAIAMLPRGPGVYRFRAAGGAVLYIGRATTLRSRVASYWSDLRDRGHLAPMVARVARVEAVACDSPHEAAWLERNLLEAAMPPWNRTPGGQESPVYLRLDARPRAPGLSVARLPRPGAGLRYYGPYLGGLRARQAVSAIGRVCPLAAAGSRVRGLRLVGPAAGALRGPRGPAAGVVAGALRAARGRGAAGGHAARLGGLRAARRRAGRRAARVSRTAQVAAAGRVAVARRR